MNGYFSRLAQSTGVRIGGASGRELVPIAREPLRSPQPLDVEETRVVGAGGVAYDTVGSPWYPKPAGNASDGIPAGMHPKGLQDGDGPGVAPTPDAGAPGVLQVAQEMSRKEVSTHHGAGGMAFDEPAVQGTEEQASGERSALSLEKLVVRMIEGDPSERTDAGDDPELLDDGNGPRINEATRSILRDVIGWIAAPSLPRDTAGSPIEEHAIGEAVERGEGQESGRGSSVPRDTAGSPIEERVMGEAVERGEGQESGRGSFEMSAHGPDRERNALRLATVRDRATEPIVQERQVREPSAHRPAAREPAVQDFTLSIGSIRIVIEEPSGTPPPSSPVRRAEPPAVAATTPESSRMSRYYI